MLTSSGVVSLAIAPESQWENSATNTSTYNMGLVDLGFYAPIGTLQTLTTKTLTITGDHFYVNLWIGGQNWTATGREVPYDGAPEFKADGQGLVTTSATIGGTTGTFYFAFDDSGANGPQNTYWQQSAHGGNPSLTCPYNNYSPAQIVSECGFSPDTPIAIWVGIGTWGTPQTAQITSISLSRTPYFTASYDGGNFHRSTTPFNVGSVLSESANSNGSISLAIDSTNSTYFDLGFDFAFGTLGSLNALTILGAGEFYVNIWLDSGNDGQFFLWSSNVLTGLGGDVYGSTGPFAKLTVTPSTAFCMEGSSQFNSGCSYTISQLQHGAVTGVNNNTLVSFWIGVATESVSGSYSATINTINGLPPTAQNIVQQNTSTVSISGGNASVNASSSTGVSVSINGTSGTSASITTTQLSSSSPGVGSISVVGVGYYDVSVAGASGGTAQVCITGSSPSTEMLYWNGTAWIDATGITTSGNTICGWIPVSDLTGTNIVIGNAPYQSYTPTGVFGNVTWTRATPGAFQYVFPASVAINGRPFSATFYESLFAQYQMSPGRPYSGFYAGTFGAISGCQQGATITITATVNGITKSASALCPVPGNSSYINLSF